MNALFCDGIDNVVVTGGMVRISLFTFDGKPGDTRQDAARVPTAHLVMAPEGFVQSYNALTRVVRQLEERGLIQRPGAAAPAAAAAKPAPAGITTEARGKGSPNF